MLAFELRAFDDSLVWEAIRSGHAGTGRRKKVLESREAPKTLLRRRQLQVKVTCGALGCSSRQHVKTQYTLLLDQS